MKLPCLISINGPTACGKTDLAITLAELLSTEVLSNDSRQFYAEMQIGTARPKTEELKGIPHHFLGDHSIFQPLSIGAFEKKAITLLEEKFSQFPTMIMVGGSMMYEKAVIEGLDELPTANEDNIQELTELMEKKGISALQELLKIIDPIYYAECDIHNPRRLLRAIDVNRQTGIPYSELRSRTQKQRKFRTFRIYIDMSRTDLYERINLRVERMMEQGLLEEAQRLYPQRHLTALQTVGYQELFDYFDGKTSLEEAVALIQQNSRRFAKRQLTWYRKMNFDAVLSPDYTRKDVLSLLDKLKI